MVRLRRSRAPSFASCKVLFGKLGRGLGGGYRRRVSHALRVPYGAIPVICAFACGYDREQRRPAQTSKSDRRERWQKAAGDRGLKR